MNTQKLLARVLAVASIVLAVGCTSAPTRPGTTGEYIDDAVTTTQVKAAIFKEPTLKSMEINVETFRGHVQLSGFVSTQANASTAMTVARGVKGVIDVKDDMRLK